MASPSLVKARGSAEGQRVHMVALLILFARPLSRIGLAEGSAGVRVRMEVTGIRRRWLARDRP